MNAAAAASAERRPRIYLAGPLFNIAEREFNRRLKSHLVAAGYDVFLPQEHEQRGAPAEAIFERDRSGVERADAVVANMDGSDPDSGTCWECGYAYALGKPVLAFRTDFRSADDKTLFNLMIAVPSTTIDLRYPEEGKDELTQLLDKIVAELAGIFLR